MVVYCCLSITFLLSVFLPRVVGIRNEGDETTSQEMASGKPCTTRLCSELAESIRDRIDESINPCDNFYEFACGSEIRRFQAELDTSNPQISKAKKTMKRNEGMISKILDPSNPPFEGPIGKYVKIAQRYQSQCIMRISKEEDDSLEDVNARINFVDSLFGKWVLGDKWGTNETTKFSRLVGTLAKTEFASPIELADLLDVEQEHVSQGRRMSIKANYEEFKNVFMYIQGVQRTLIGKYPSIQLPEDTFLDIKSVGMEFVTLMGKHKEKTTPTNGIHFFKDLAGFKTWWGQTTGKQYNLLDWDVAFRALSLSIYEAIAKGAQPPYNTSIVVKGGDNKKISDLGEFLTVLYELGPQKTFTLAKGAAIIKAFNHEDQVKDMTEMRKKVGKSGKTAASVCMDRTSAGAFEMLLSAAFIRLPEVAFDLEQKRVKTTEVWKNMIAAFIANLKDLDWLDSKTVENAEEKARAMGAKLLYPDWLIDENQVEMVYADVPQIEHLMHYDTLDLALSGWKKTRGLREIGVKPFSLFWLIAPHQFNMIYNWVANDIAVPTAFVQPPFSASRAMGASLFGKLGTIIGHEITHGFDSDGHKLDKMGEPHDWWDPKTKQHFEEKTKCFVNQIGQMEIDGHKMSNCFGSDCDGNPLTITEGPPGTKWSNKSVANRTLGENIADVGGVGISWLAYREWMRKNGQEFSPEGLGYSPAQVFFMEFASSFCRGQSSENRKEQLAEDVHLVSELRVNAALKNSIPFAKAFKCASDAVMNPERKCRIWGAVPSAELP